MPESVILSPPPVFFIKSISEQGYSLSTAISDLIDNSIAADASRVEILIDSSQSPLRVYIADNGTGMTGSELTKNMRFPSADLDLKRSGKDLGRFGIGLKTASFSQSRKFTVVSKKDNYRFEGRTWDVEFLKHTEDWSLIIETESSVNTYINEFNAVSNNFHEQISDFRIGTIVIWDNLYKLESVLRKNEIIDEIDELRSHLGLVFHRFIQSRKLQIRLNNWLVEGFDPFPHGVAGVQTVAESFWQTSDAYIKFQGIVLPKRSASESKDSSCPWVPTGRTLEELQGIFVYRNERLINFGGWHRAIPKSIYLQFGRIRIDITNTNDTEFHLNVAKSTIRVPFGLKRAMAEMVKQVATQAQKEYRERLASNIIRPKTESKGLSLIIKETGAAGPVLRINPQFEILRLFETNLSPENSSILKLIISLIENKLNEIWMGELNVTEIEDAIDQSQKAKILKIKEYYEQAGYSWEEIKTVLLDSFGRGYEAESFINSLNKS